MDIESNLPIDDFLRECGINTCKLNKHKLSGNGKKCMLCNKSAIYGVPTSEAKYCSAHKPIDARDVVTRLCPCGRVPHYGVKRRISCNECKLPGHRLIDSRVCACGKYATFGPPSGGRMSCGKCKLEGYILLTAKKCPLCNIKLARFGPPGGKKLTCKDCKEPDYVDLSKGPRCIVCERKANYRLPGCRSDRCEEHKTENHI